MPAAARDGDAYVVNGTKMWTTHAGAAEWGILYARTGEQGEKGGISCFILDADAPGLTKIPIDVMASYSPFELHLEDVRIPVSNRIGEEGGGFELARQYLVNNRILTPRSIGTPSGRRHTSVGKGRQTYREDAQERQGVQWMLPTCEIELRAAGC